MTPITFTFTYTHKVYREVVFNSFIENHPDFFSENKLFLSSILRSRMDINKGEIDFNGQGKLYRLDLVCYNAKHLNAVLDDFYFNLPNDLVQYHPARLLPDTKTTTCRTCGKTFQ